MMQEEDVKKAKNLKNNKDNMMMLLQDGALLNHRSQLKQW